MFDNLLTGNIFSFLAAVCLAVSVVRKDKKGLIGWQIFDTLCGALSNWFLQSYAAMTISIMCVLRNLLAYYGKLGKFLTVLLLILGTMIGLYTNNRGLIGWLPVAASAEYTVCMYILKSAQGMRYALITNLLMWLIHDVYICSYPMAVMDVVLCLWTIWQAWLSSRKDNVSEN
ncbi:MAG: YgjV family protein [Alphaproteobacteria bacterium]|nr:YgjV family protein [Alphaproteobacteria bacterium]